MEPIFLKFQGNIENGIAICNISENCKNSTKANRMYIPSEFCTEENDIIFIEKKTFKSIEKKGIILYQ